MNGTPSDVSAWARSALVFEAGYDAAGYAWAISRIFGNTVIENPASADAPDSVARAWTGTVSTPVGVHDWV